MGPDGVDAGFLQPGQGRVKAHDPRQVQSPSLEPVRQEGRHLLGVAGTAGAAGQQRLQLRGQLRPQQEAPVPWGPISPLWPVKARASAPMASMSMGKAPAVWAVSSRNSRPFSRQKVPTSAAGSRVPQTLLAWSITTARVFSRSRPGRRSVISVPSGRQDPVEGDAPAGQLGQGTHDGVVLHGGHQHMVPGPQQALQQDVQAFGDVLGERHASAVRPVEQAAQLLAGAQHRLLRLIRPLIAAPADVAAAAGDIVEHGLGHLGRLGEAGAGVVQINRLHMGPSRNNTLYFQKIMVDINYYYMIQCLLEFFKRERYFSK